MNRGNNILWYKIEHFQVVPNTPPTENCYKSGLALLENIVLKSGSEQ